MMSPEESTVIPSSTSEHSDVESPEVHISGHPSDVFRFRALPKVKKFIVITFSLVNFCVGVFYSALGPFFPNEAALKHINNTTTGLIFGIFELVLFIMSPVFGNFYISSKQLTSIGAKFMYCSGVFVCGCCGILFGFLDGIQDGFRFSLMCLLVRGMEGVGAAAYMTASFAIMAHAFPDHVATVFGTLELFSGLGFMIGPPIGGALYQLGGFKLPFISFGVLVIIIGLFSVMLLPSVQDISGRPKRFILGLLRIPVVCIMCLYLMLGASVIGFLDIGMAKFLYRVPGLSKVILIVGYFVAGLSYIFLGPAPFLPIANNHIWLVIICLAASGLGLGTMVITFQIITKGTQAFLGPTFGGYLIDKVEFQMASTYLGFSLIAVGLLYLVYCLILKITDARMTHDTSEPSDSQSESSLLCNDQQPSTKYHTLDR
ncbi:hypothetical protein LSH36_236g04048 [Paralvinella palmiformis]|uniref:Major facilitator superfamily (MFS) profile domain-containing protein n=1 Tax=Paralvinella palmiformis TaxID=53620 RepID=A0AAD9JNB9_9ANNE|nr:hypothetical protein LSH36_236g04048 [Paralvinella palmiformis]